MAVVYHHGFSHLSDASFVLDQPRMKVSRGNEITSVANMHFMISFKSNPRLPLQGLTYFKNRNDHGLFQILGPADVRHILDHQHHRAAEPADRHDEPLLPAHLRKFCKCHARGGHALAQ